MQYSTISFPVLDLSMNPGYKIDIGPLSFHYYGLIIALGLLLAIIYGLTRSKTFGLKQDDILDGVLGIVPFAIICARAYYCIFSWDEYAANPISVLYIWNGGLAIYGGVIGAVIGVLVYCKIKKLSIGAVLDVVALGFLIGQAIGRWGNFFNREAFGAETEFFMRMGLQNIYTGAVTYHHPTFLYESLWNVVGFVALHLLSYRRQYDGQIALGYVAWYGLGRALIEGLRTDSLYWGSFRVSQMLAAISCLAAAVILMYQTFRTHDRENLFVYRRAAAEAAAAEAAAIAAEEAVEAGTAEEAVEEVAAEESTVEEAAAEETAEETPEETGTEE